MERLVYAMLAHTIREIRCYTCVEFSLLINDIDVPVVDGNLMSVRADSVKKRDGLPSRRELVLSHTKEGKPFDKLKAGSRPALAGNRKPEILKGPEGPRTSYAGWTSFGGLGGP